MTDMTARLALPFIVAGQAQKDVTHNEALTALDAWVQPAMEDRDLATPPASPVEGQLWLVAGGAAGDWAGQDGMIAHYIGADWRFYAPAPGMALWLRDEARMLRFDGAAWLEAGPACLGPAAAAIADPAGGGVIDNEARTAIAAMLSVLRQYGLIAT